MTRRTFFKQVGMGVAATASTAALAPLNAAETKPLITNAAPTSLKLGIAGYTFNKFKLDQALEMLKRVDVHYLCIKDFHLPLTSTPEEIAAFHEKCKSFGVTGYGVGPIYMGSQQAVHDAFAYAKRVGVKTLVGVPFKMVEKTRVADAELLTLINEKVKEYDIAYAIHNHGPDMPELFPNSLSAMEMIDKLDRRIGLCLDIGHEFRDGGRCPAQAIIKYADRIHDVHIKNVTAPNKSGRGIEMPRGEVNITAVVRALRKINYQGVCSLEYEKDMADPLLGIAESIGYFRGVLDATRPS